MNHGSDNGGISKFFAAIDAADDELASLRGSYMSQCKGPRGTIKEILGSVRESGQNMKAFQAVLKKHREDRKQERRILALEAEDAQAYQELLQELGEFASTPLGEAALSAHRGRRSGDEALSSLRS